MKSGPTMDCDFTVEEYLAHLLEALQVTSQVLVVDVRKGANKEYLYTAQEENNSDVNEEPGQQYKYDDDYLYKVQDDSKVMNVKPIQLTLSTDSNINEELTLDDISNLIMEMDEIFTDIENTKDQLAPANCDNVDGKEDDVSHVQDIITCKTITNEEFERIDLMETGVEKVSNQTIADDYNIHRELKTNKNQMNTLYIAKIEIHLKCQQCGYTCLSYDIFTAHQNRYCYYSR